MGMTELAIIYTHAAENYYSFGRYLISFEGKSTTMETLLVLDDVFGKDIDDDQRMAADKHISAILDCLRS